MRIEIDYNEYRKRREEFDRPDAIVEFVREKKVPYEIRRVIINVPSVPYISGVTPGNQRVDSERKDGNIF